MVLLLAKTLLTQLANHHESLDSILERVDEIKETLRDEMPKESRPFRKDVHKELNTLLENARRGLNEENTPSVGPS